MAGFCTQCGRRLNERLECSRHPQQRAGTELILRKPSTMRRLLGAGLEFTVYQITAAFIVVVSVVTVGAMDAFFALLLIFFISIRDSHSGLFSLEKRLGRMRVVKRGSGLPISNVDGLKRNGYYLLPPIAALLPILVLDQLAVTLFQVFVLLDLLMIVFRPDGRRLGDLLAGTQVVVEQREGG